MTSASSFPTSPTQLLPEAQGQLCLRGGAGGLKVTLIDSGPSQSRPERWRPETPGLNLHGGHRCHALGSLCEVGTSTGASSGYKQVGLTTALSEQNLFICRNTSPTSQHVFSMGKDWCSYFTDKETKARAGDILNIT